MKYKINMKGFVWWAVLFPVLAVLLQMFHMVLEYEYRAIIEWRLIGFPYPLWTGMKVGDVDVYDPGAVLADLIFTLIFLCVMFSIVIACRVKRKTGICDQCGYNLTGNQTGLCPECGCVLTEPSEAEGSV